MTPLSSPSTTAMSEETFALTALMFVIALGFGVAFSMVFPGPIDRWLDKMEKKRAKPA